MSSDFVAGYVSGAVGILIGNPLDLVKVRLQARRGDESLRASSQGHGYFETKSSLIKGAAAPILGYGALNALLFVAYNRSLKFLDPSVINPTNLDANVSLMNIWLAGAAGGMASWVISSPTELVKCRTQLSRNQNISSWTVFRDILRVQGVRGLYFGGLITSIRDSVGYGFYFWSYELCKRSLSSLDDSSQQEALKVLLCGGVAGIITWASVFPLDVVKTRLQAQPFIAHTVSEVPDFQRRLLPPTSSSRPRILNSLEIARDAYRSEGFSVFFRGLGICSVRAFIVNAAQWAVYEWLMKEFNRASTAPHVSM
ncbi:mitochondrial carrier protein, putative [Talaromyces stipitatus ATCC 10500]|uniref:Mitochondrial carrier protein, putative n=1 Tax=Talaromyces stipitatus (strain ATCC 10500 / CBS 375.48 / QM 6759 / NRRL 1006) TaxID=441959 RepID=B8MCZ9_TALSN|nr:mitochondrial carrier protein, putative [Talaromyces stipitatus ATCC 10500]EED17525.1 mitochondrial carrier protein, putative [Talaromyces stipitatus ATCC 10500]